MAATRIPPEIWIQIIRNACYVPPIDMRNYDPLPSNGSYHVHSGKLIMLIREALSIKYAISLVCRLWSTFVVEILYDFIIVRDAVHIPLIVDQLSRAGTHIHQRVQRIDFMCVAATRDVCYNGMSYNATQLACAAAKLIRLCPHLRALSSPASLWERDDTITSNCYTQLLATALVTVKESLECLEWRSRWSFHSTMKLSRLILPRLQQMVFSAETNYTSASFVDDSHWDDIITDTSEDDDDSDYPECAKDRPTIRKWTYSPLPTVDGEFYWNWTPSYEYEWISERLSFMTHLIITSIPFWYQLQDQWSLLPQINTITFQHGGFRLVTNEGCSLPSTIHTVILHARDLPITPPSFPHIKRIGLMGAEELAPGEYDYAFNLFVGQSGSEDDYFSFPILDMIRFVDTSFSRIFRKRKLQFKLWEHRCRSKGIRLEDETGRHLTTLDRL